MIRQLSSAGPPSKYLHNYDNKFVKFLQKKESKKKLKNKSAPIELVTQSETLFFNLELVTRNTKAKK